MSSELEEWVLRNFRGRPSEKAILLAAADATPANDCVVSIKLLDLIVRSNVSAREFYRCIPTLDEERWLRRMSPWRSSTPVRSFHHERFCDYSAKLAEYESSPSPLCPRKQSTVPDLRNSLPAWQSEKFLPFERQGFGQEKCEECKGQGDRWIPRPDGLPGKVRVLCAHRIAAIAGWWKRAGNWQLDRWEEEQRSDELRALLAKETEVPAAEQVSFDWVRANVRSQKARLEEWLREHPEAAVKSKA